ncbi:hypothetical protein GCM10010498_56820 [Streptomyces cavourensis]|nr:hypothetical protein GCM10010498_56820 [Streptomyces cavourensis]
MTPCRTSGPGGGAQVPRAGFGRISQVGRVCREAARGAPGTGYGRDGYGTFGTGRWARSGGEGSVRNAPPAVVLGRAPLRDPAEWVAEGAPEAGTTGVDVDAAPRSAPPATVWPKTAIVQQLARS